MLIALLLVAAAEAGLIRDWWVPADGACLVHPDADEVQQAAADDLATCRSEGTRESADGIVTTDWSAVAGCMTSRGWEKRSRGKWEAWNERCASEVARKAEDYAVLTAELARELQIVPTPPPPPPSTAVPPGMLGRTAEDP